MGVLSFKLLPEKVSFFSKAEFTRTAKEWFPLAFFKMSYFKNLFARTTYLMSSAFYKIRYFSVFLSMSFAGLYFKILYSIVKFILIFMVDNLILFKWSANIFRHYKSMFQYITMTLRHWIKRFVQISVTTFYFNPRSNTTSHLGADLTFKITTRTSKFYSMFSYLVIYCWCRCSELSSYFCGWFSRSVKHRNKLPIKFAIFSHKEILSCLT